MIRLFVIEDHPVIVTGIRNLFRPSRDNIEVIGYAFNPDDAIEKADPATFDIFLLDLLIPGFHPTQNVKRLKEKFPGKPIVMFTSEDSSAWRKKMFEAGVMAYLIKNAEKSEIKSTLEKVSKGIVMITGKVDASGESDLVSAFTEAKYAVTDNQRDIIHRLSIGQNQQEIADSKNTSVSNIEKTLKHIKNKCGARSNTELIRIMIERGVI